MTRITVDLSREKSHWRIQLAVNGEVHPRHVFGCTEALAPLIAALSAADAEQRSIWTTTDTDAPIRPATIAIGMPSGRVLTFKLTSVQQTLPDVP
jgi:hypothetical protein